MRDDYAFISRFYDAFSMPALSRFRLLTADILRKFTSLPTIKVLEVACGTGSQAEVLARHGFNVVALDKSPGMLRQARKRAVGNNSTGFALIRGDASNLPFEPDQFHAVVVQFALHEMPENVRDGCMREIKRVAKENALFIFLDFVPTRVRPLTPLLWLVELGAGWNHFNNAREFVQKGGLPRLLKRHRLAAGSSYYFFQRHIGLAVARRNRS